MGMYRLTCTDHRQGKFSHETHNQKREISNETNREGARGGLKITYKTAQKVTHTKK